MLPSPPDGAVQEFDQIFKGLGGRVSHTHLLSETAQTILAAPLQYAKRDIQSVLTRLRIGPAHQLFVDWLYSPSFQARATRGTKTGCMFIGVTAGLSMQIHRLNAALAAAEVIDSNGMVHPSRTDPAVISRVILPPSLELLADNGEMASALWIRAPRTGEAWATANLLNYLGLHFVFMHEFAHIIRNHLCWFRGAGIAEFDMAESQSGALSLGNTDPTFEIHQVMEYDADRVATLLAAELLISILKNPAAASIGAWGSILADPPKAFKIWLISFANVVFWMDEASNRLNLPGDWNAKHPAPSVRLVLAMQHLLDHLAREGFPEEWLSRLTEELTSTVGRMWDIWRRSRAQGALAYSLRSEREGIHAHAMKLHRLFELWADKISARSFLKGREAPPGALLVP